jgi:hypothetical protein
MSNLGLRIFLSKLTQAKACGYQIIFNAMVAATFKVAQKENSNNF